MEMTHFLVYLYVSHFRKHSNHLPNTRLKCEEIIVVLRIVVDMQTKCQLLFPSFRKQHFTEIGLKQKLQCFKMDAEQYR